MHERSHAAAPTKGRGTLAGRLAGFFRLLSLDAGQENIARKITAHAEELEHSHQRQAERIHGLERQLEEVRAARR